MSNCPICPTVPTLVFLGQFTQKESISCKRCISPFSAYFLSLCHHSLGQWDTYNGKRTSKQGLSLIFCMGHPWDNCDTYSGGVTMPVDISKIDLVALIEQRAGNPFWQALWYR